MKGQNAEDFDFAKSCHKLYALLAFCVLFGSKFTLFS